MPAIAFFTWGLHGDESSLLIALVWGLNFYLCDGWSSL